MNWFYAECGKAVGPVTGDAFKHLVQAGGIDASTLVWREGMAEWKPFGELAQTVSAAELVRLPPPVPTPPLAAGQQVCASCKAAFGSDDLVRFGEVFVCGACKPRFLQRLREGLAATDAIPYASFWPRFGAKIVDMLIEGIVSYSTGALAGLIVFGTARVAFAQPDGMDDFAYFGFSAVMFLFNSLVGAIWLGWMMTRWGASPGKLLFRLRVVRPDGSGLTFRRGFARYFAEILSAIGCLIGYFLVLFDEEKRSLHDRICDTRVVRKS